MENDLEEYVKYILDELRKLKNGRFTGNVEFKVNLIDGGIGNMNVLLYKSVKLGR